MITEINPEFSEFIGIMLGDGNIYVNDAKWQYQLDISLNRDDEPRYVLHVKNLMESLFLKNVKISKQHGKAVSLRYYSKKIIVFLLNQGLKPGKKTYNQVAIPPICFKNQKFMIGCLKGLFDTDGSIEIDSPKDLRITFTNCSKPLVENFRDICIKLGIKPSPSLIFSKDRCSWKLMIARKDEIRKFLDIIKPERIKEPNRRIWLATKLIFLNSPADIRLKIEKQIISFLDKNNQRIFRFSKENTQFFKSMCEDMLKIRINESKINKELNKVLNLEKCMYSVERARNLKYLYEKLRSSKRIVEYLINTGELLIPNRQTITKHIKRYHDENSINYDKWHSNYPKMRFSLNKLNKVKIFPNELRNTLIEMIMKIINSQLKKPTEFEIMRCLKQSFNDQNMLIMNWLLSNPKYAHALYEYLVRLIVFCRYMLYIDSNGIKLNITNLAKNRFIDFDRGTLRYMINHLRNKNVIRI